MDHTACLQSVSKEQPLRTLFLPLLSFSANTTGFQTFYIFSNWLNA